MNTTFEVQTNIAPKREETLLLDALQRVAESMQELRDNLVALQLVAPNTDVTRWTLDFNSSVISRASLLRYALKGIGINMNEVQQ